jgi:prevent-host-death family protein
MTATATEVKNRFGEFLERAQREPVVVEKSGRPVVVLMAHDEYERFQALEDRYWGERAREAAKSGYVGHETAMAVLMQRLQEVEGAGVE